MGLAAAAIALRNIADVGEKRARIKLRRIRMDTRAVAADEYLPFLIFKSFTRLLSWLRCA
jgi:hypothetical protein